MKKHYREPKNQNPFVSLNVEYKGELLWCIFENSTEQVVAAFKNQEEAISYRKFLENGGAFAGFTPTFMALT